MMGYCSGCGHPVGYEPDACNCICHEREPRTGAEKAVRKALPNARCMGMGTSPTSHGYLTFRIVSPLSDLSRDFPTRELAWADAARRLKENRK